MARVSVSAALFCAVALCCIPAAPLPAQQYLQLTFEAVDALDHSAVPLDSIRVTGLGFPLDTLLQEVNDLRIDLLTGVDRNGIPMDFSLSAPHANPFSDVSFFDVTSSETTAISLHLRAIDGKIVATWNDRVSPGISRFRVDGAALPAGVYLLALETGSGHHIARKLVKLSHASAGTPHIQCLGTSPAIPMGKSGVPLTHLRATGYRHGWIPATVEITVTQDSSVTFDMMSEAHALITWLEDPSRDFLNTVCPAIVTAQMVYEDVTGAKLWHIIDIRQAQDYAAGHIPGSVNVQAGDLFTHIASLGNPERIVLTGYTGQSESFYAALLRLAGFDHVYALKYGMSSWHHDFDRVSVHCGSMYDGMFTDVHYPKGPAGPLPSICTGKTTAPEILEARIAAVLSSAYGAFATTADVVIAAPSMFALVNYWNATHYENIGHLPGAMQYTPKSDLKLGTYLRTLPVDKTVAIYDYTGMGTAQVAAVLAVMGYDVKSVSYGTQGMIWERLKSFGITAFDPATDCFNFP
ncbi:MAG: hypothetical protein JXA28_10430, partial [Bacteroidetes bacterium]|nr:hypothetical protein [Bacteroidota bacterium]